jgi:hypothetical protein
MPHDEEYDRLIKQLLLMAYIFAAVSLVIGAVFFVSGLYEIIND